ncbi:hypothetical protein BDP27DRAFT_1417341 [Rhodocollybia butyracea]|uniref:C2H2-type domain-containing protein n=1 Tax=Rhodocollybia butyracea TaxID=206335 RepID=A0A9P5UBL5_9AGAR|nr:hypothetical protein BDP27DRAFT_1417341 [Rhodocollybia butyracea]
MPRVASLKFVNVSSPECIECGLVLAHRHDMRRHMLTHQKMAAVKYRCSWPGCSHEALQKNNLDVHYRTHSQDKCKICPDCEFRTCDGASLIRHRKRIHAYVPQPRKARAKKQAAPASTPKCSLGTSSDSKSTPKSDSPNPSSSPSSEPSLSSLPSTSPSSHPHPSSVVSDDELSLESICKPFFPAEIASNVDDLFHSISLFGGVHFDELRPRPLFPAVGSTPSLQFFHPNSAPTDERLGAHQTWFPSPHMNFYGSCDVQCGDSLDADDASLASQDESDEFAYLHDLDVAMQCMAEMDPSTAVTVSVGDFEAIFGDDEQSPSRSPSPPWSDSSCSSGLDSTTTTTTSSSPWMFTGSLLAELYAPL